MKVLIDVSPRDLPESFQALVDPEQALAHPARFAPAGRDGGFLSWLILTGCLALIVLLAVGVAREGAAMSAGEAYSTPNLVLGLLFIAPLAWWALRQVRLIRLGRAQARELAAGRYRRGVFFVGNAALHHDGRVCTLIPKGRVLRIDRRPAENIESGAQAMGTHIVFKGPDGKEHSRGVPGAGWDGKARVWHKTGTLPR